MQTVASPSGVASQGPSGFRLEGVWEGGHRGLPLPYKYNIRPSPLALRQSALALPLQARAAVADCMPLGTGV